jgi:glycosyltransferase involved in cell wall biosynthesis
MSDKMPKVLVINTVAAAYNGITTVILNFAKATCKKVEYSFLLCAGGEDGIINELKSMGDVIIPSVSRNGNPIAYTLWLRNLVKSKKYSAVHVHGNSGTMYFDVLGAKLGGCKTRIVHCHSSSCTHSTAHKILKPLLNIDMTLGIGCSDLARKWLFTRKSMVMYNGIDVEKFRFSRSVRQEYRSSLDIGDNLLIGHVGYMDGVKNHLFLLSAFAKAISKRPEMTLLLIGDGDLRPQIEEFISTNGLEKKVILLGRRSDVDKLYQAMDVFVLPSLFEGLPVTLVEAQASGLPCFASSAVTRQADLGGVSYLDIGNEYADKWADALIAINPSLNRDEWCDRVAQTDFNIGVTAEKLLEFYGSK